jgi:DNA-binding SARP family transcriptional activator
LAILASARGAVVSRDALIEALWQQTPRRDPSGGLDTAVSLLRRAIGSDGSTVVETHRPGYRLACETDLDDLARLESAGDLEAALAMLDREPFEGEPPCEWLETQRRDLACRRLELLVKAGHQAAARGDDDRAAQRYRSAIESDPLREDGHRGLMAALAGLGRQAEALRSYERCRRVLREELGVDPSPETQALYEQVLAGRSAGRAAAVSGVAGELPFLGRDSELRRLRAAVAVGPRVVVVIGEPGIGKTRLLTEALGGPAEVRTTKCFRLIAPVPFAVLDDLLPGLLDADADANGRSGVSLAPEAAMARLTIRVEEQLPADAMFVVDDLQWADEPSLQVLAMAIRRRVPLRIVAAAREGDLDPSAVAAQFIELAGTLGLLERIELRALRPEEVQAGGLSFADWQHTGGHPLFLAERARGGGAGDLAGLVLGRARGLGADGADVLRVVAVLDRVVRLDELAELSSVPLDRIRQVAAGLAREGLLVETGGQWRPRHDVIAELVRDDLDVAVRRGMHQRVLAHLSAVGGPAAELAHHALGAGNWAAAIAHSVAAGEEALAAFANLEAAAHFARARTLEAEHGAVAPELRRRAVLGESRALLILGQPDDARRLVDELAAGVGRDEVERLLITAECGWVAWKPTRALAPAAQALELAETIGDDLLVGRVHAFIANPYGSLGEFDRALHHVGAAVAAFEARGQEPPAIVWYRRALIEHHTGRENDALVTLDRCRSAALAQYDERSLIFERWVRCLALAGLGRYGEALAALDDIATIGKGEEVTARSRVPNTRASLLFDLGLVEAALDADEESLEIARAHGGDAVAEPQIQTLLNLAVDHLHLGHLDRAAACLAEAEGLAVDAEYARFRFMNRMQYVRGLLALEAGNPDTALAAAQTTAEMAAHYRAPKNEIRARLLRGAALARSPAEEAAALTEFRAAVRLAERLGFAALAQQAHRAAANASGSAHHARRADLWRARIVASVDEPLRSRLFVPGKKVGE